MKRKNVTIQALRSSARRSVRASAALENRAAPAEKPRSERVERFLAGRKQKS